MKSAKYLTLALITGIILSGCSIEYGQQVISSHYVYPNSNVTPLGYTSAELSKIGIIFPSQIKKNDYERLFNEALSKHQGADIIIDMGIDVKYTQIPIPILTIWITKFTLQGTAANMEVGEQDLSHFRDQALDQLVERTGEKD